MTLDLTLVIPCKDSFPHIYRTLASISSQTCKPSTVIVIDDSENSEPVRQSILCFPELHINLIHGDKKGLPYALNRAFNLSTTKYLSWINSDDFYFSPLSLQFVASFFSHENDFIYGNSLHISPTFPSGRLLRAWKNYFSNYDGSNNIFTGSLFFSNAAWRSFGGFPNTLSLAFEYSLINYLFKNYTASYVCETIAVFNNHGNNLSTIYHDQLSSELSTLSLPSTNHLLRIIDRALSYVSHP